MESRAVTSSLANWLHPGDCIKVDISIPSRWKQQIDSASDEATTNLDARVSKETMGGTLRVRRILRVPVYQRQHGDSRRAVEARRETS